MYGTFAIHYSTPPAPNDRTSGAPPVSAVPYQACPRCRSTVYAAAAGSTRAVCPVCEAPLVRSPGSRHGRSTGGGVAALRVLHAGPHAPLAARRALDGLDGLDPDERRWLGLLVSELVTNSVRHSGISNAQTVSVAVSVGYLIRLEVTDPGAGFERPRELRAGNGQGGFGLFLVDRVASRWGVERGPETRVWLELDRPPGEQALQPSSLS